VSLNTLKQARHARAKHWNEARACRRLEAAARNTGKSTTAAEWAAEAARHDADVAAKDVEIVSLEARLRLF
jgi:hypothetical protein